MKYLKENTESNCLLRKIERNWEFKREEKKKKTKKEETIWITNWLPRPTSIFPFQVPSLAWFQKTKTQFFKTLFFFLFSFSICLRKLFFKVNVFLKNESIIQQIHSWKLKIKNQKFKIFYYPLIIVFKYIYI